MEHSVTLSLITNKFIGVNWGIFVLGIFAAMKNPDDLKAFPPL